MVFVVVDFAVVVVVLLSFLLVFGFCFKIDLWGAAMLVRSLTMKSTKVDS